MYWNGTAFALYAGIEKINSNIGCIETNRTPASSATAKKINSNIGCIETGK